MIESVPGVVFSQAYMDDTGAVTFGAPGVGGVLAKLPKFHGASGPECKNRLAWPCSRSLSRPRRPT
eukprot:6313692-Lingulodinium_polyedra.AAC.1